MNRELNLSEQEIQALTATISLTRIQRRIEDGTGLPAGTLTQSQSLTPTSPPADKTRLLRPSWRKLFPTIAAAIIALLLLGTVAYAWQNGYLTSFFGEDSGVPLTQVITPGKSVTDDGLIITLEEILPGEAGGLVVISFAWEDGRAFPEDIPMIGELQVGAEGALWNQFSMQFQLREDNRQLVCYYESKTTEKIVGQELIVSGNTLYAMNYEEVPMETSVQDYLAATGHTLSKLEAQAARESVPTKLNAADEDEEVDEDDWINHWLAAQPVTTEAADLLALPRPETETNMTFKGMVLIEDCLYLSVTHSPVERQPYGGNTAGIYKLLDTRTGQVLPYDLGGLTVYGFRGIKAADLPYLVPIVDYHIYEILTAASWYFTQQIADTGQITRISLTEHIAPSPSVDEPFQLTEVVITPIEVVIYGEYMQAGDFDYLPQDYRPDVSLILNDGTQVPMRVSGGHLKEPRGQSSAGKPKGFYFSLQIARPESLSADEEQAPRRLFIDEALQAELAYLLIDDQEVPLP